MARCYDQYCPMAHALDLVGERWSLLIVRELLEDDQLRYSDLHARLPGCGTNILAARLKTLEQGGSSAASARPAGSVVGLRADGVRRGTPRSTARARALGRTIARPAARVRRPREGLAPGRAAHRASSTATGRDRVPDRRRRRVVVGTSRRARSTTRGRSSPETTGLLLPHGRARSRRSVDRGRRRRRARDPRVASPAAAHRSPRLDEAARVLPRPRLELDPALAAELSYGVEDDASAPVDPPAEQVENRDALRHIAAHVEREHDGGSVDTRRGSSA